MGLACGLEQELEKLDHGRGGNTRACRLDPLDPTCGLERTLEELDLSRGGSTGLWV